MSMGVYMLLHTYVRMYIKAMELRFNTHALGECENLEHFPSEQEVRT